MVSLLSQQTHACTQLHSVEIRDQSTSVRVFMEDGNHSDSSGVGDEKSTLLSRSASTEPAPGNVRASTVCVCVCVIL